MYWNSCFVAVLRQGYCTRILVSSNFSQFFCYFWPIDHVGSSMCVCCVKLLRQCQAFCDPMDCSLPGSSVHGSSRQEYWRGLPCASPGILPTQGLTPCLLCLLHWQAGSFIITSATWESGISTLYFLKYFEVYLYLVLIFSLSLYLPSTFFSSLLSFSHFLLVSVDFFPHASIFMFMVITTQ